MKGNWQCKEIWRGIEITPLKEQKEMNTHFIT